MAASDPPESTTRSGHEHSNSYSIRNLPVYLASRMKKATMFNQTLEDILENNLPEKELAEVKRLIYGGELE